jgi:hypothetical protein
MQGRNELSALLDSLVFHMSEVGPCNETADFEHLKSILSMTKRPGDLLRDR